VSKGHSKRSARKGRGQKARATTKVAQRGSEGQQATTPRGDEQVRKGAEVAKSPVAEELSPEDQAAATQRMAEVFKALASAPEGFLPMLERLEVNYQIVPLSAESAQTVLFEVSESDSDSMYLVVKMTDLIEGEERNQKQGSLLDRLSVEKPGDKVAKLAKRLSGFGIRSDVFGLNADNLPKPVWDKIIGEDQKEGDC